MDALESPRSPDSRHPADGQLATVRLSLLGGFGLWHEQRPIALPWSAQRVVAYVALRDRPALRSHVAAALWLDTIEERALANLRSALWRLRRPGLDIVEVTGDLLSLSARVSVDVRELTGLARDLLGAAWTADRPASSSETRSETQPAEAPPADRLSLAGEILPGWFDDWVFVERERFRSLRLHALERACRFLAAAGEFGRAIDAGLAAVSEEPLRESAHRALIEAHLAEGNRIEALRQFQAYERVMRDELGLEPSPAMAELVAGFRPAATVAR